jgi:large subunit ribosomal protein L12e
VLVVNRLQCRLLRPSSVLSAWCVLFFLRKKKKKKKKSFFFSRAHNALPSQSPKKVGDDVQKATKNWKGLKVTCKVLIQNRQCTVEVVPSAASLLIQALKEPARNRKTEKNILHNGNLTINDVYGVARKMRERSLAKHFSGTVKEILGTARSIGCTVDGQPPQQLIDAINKGELTTPEQ